MKISAILFPGLIILAGALSFSACQQGGASVDLAQVRTEIQTAEDAWAAAMNARDIEALVAMYTDDAVSMPDNAPALTGKDAIRRQMEKEFGGSPEGLTFAFEVLDVYGDGNTVTEIGKSTHSDASGNKVGGGKYMCVWQKRGDKYLCAREIYNGDAPTPPAATRSLHLFDLPTGLTEAEWAAALKEINAVIAGLGHPGAGYYFYKTESADVKNYRYFFEGVWPSEAAYREIHDNPEFASATARFGEMYDKIKAVEIYRRMNRVK